VSCLISEDDDLQGLKKTNNDLQKRLQEKEIAHLKLVISNLKGTSYQFQLNYFSLIKVFLNTASYSV
jgi:hypothetical protein